MNSILIMATLGLFSATQLSKAATVNIDKIVHSKFDLLIDQSQPKEKRYRSIVVGVVTPLETRIIPLGALTEGGISPSSSTIFEIGSITKGFVGLALAQESLKGSIDLESSFNKTSSTPKLPNYSGVEITWRNLAQHTAGFPRVPSNLNPSNPPQPYIDYDFKKLEEFLSGFSLPIRPGVTSDYSNLGAGIAGLGLEQISRKSLEQVFIQDILNKLNMNDTRVMVDTEQISRMAPVFLNGGQVEAWQWKDISVLQGAGALRSTMQDMTSLLKTMMGLSNQDFYPAVALATKPTFEKDANTQLGLFWHRLKSENIVWHNGGTYGSTSFLGYDPDRLVGIVVLSNSNIIDDQGVDPRIDIASIKAIQEIVSGLQMSKPIKALTDYDTEIQRRISEFEKTPANLKDKAWVQLKIAHMFDIDQYMRNLFMNISDQNFTQEELSFFQQGYGHRFYMMDWQNTQDLKQILKLHGWFKVSEWGKQTDRQAWLLVQHADNEPEFQKEVLAMLDTLYRLKETDPSNYAYLFDRVAASFKDPTKRKLQRYGTQGSCVAPGKWEPLAMEDPSNVDKRRAEVGLEPLKNYIDRFKEICK